MGPSIKIRGSARQLIVVCLVCVLGFALTALSTFPDEIGFGISVFEPPFGLFLMAVTVLCFAAALPRLLQAGQPVIEMSEAGFLDRRQLKEPIPWEIIQGIGVQEIEGRRYLTFQIAQEDRGQIKRYLGSRLLAAAPLVPEQPFGVQTYGVNIELKELAEMVLVASSRYGHPIPIPGSERAQAA